MKPLKLPAVFDGTVVYLAYGRRSFKNVVTGERPGKQTLLYVGISDTFYKRMGQHASKSEWWPFAERLEIEVYETRHQAQVRERQLVSQHSPPFNEQLITSRERDRRQDFKDRLVRCASLNCNNGLGKHRRYCDACVGDTEAKRAARLASGQTVYRFGGR